MTNSPASSETLPELQLVDRLCKRHGAYKARCFPSPFEGLQPVVSNCPQCVTEAAERKEIEAQEQRERERVSRIKGLVEESLIPARYQSATIDGFQGDALGQVRVRQACDAFVRGWGESRWDGPSIVMCGRPGTGKTHLACGIGIGLIERYSARVRFHTALSAIRTIKETYHRDSETSESEAINRLVAPELLILDEIGVQVGSEHERMLVFEVINERYQQCRSTILISNLDRKELGEYMGDRIMDRFRECGGILAFDWQSYRGTKRA